MKKAFESGDKVYYPEKTNRILEVKSSDDIMYPLKVHGYYDKSDSFTIYGLKWQHGLAPSLFHATEENYKKLSEFYDIGFEKPFEVKNSQEIIQAMLDDGWRHVPVFCMKDGEKCRSFVSRTWSTMSAIPFDPKTGKRIVDYKDGQVITGIKLW